MFKRGSDADAEMVASSPEPGITGKGRPTPKRKESERGRRRVAAAPLDRKEAYRRNRDQQREQRRRMMQALKAGDERHLPARDRGPVRAYVRDMVDSRRSVGEFFLPLALVILVLTTVGNPQVQMIGSTLWLALVVLIIVDAVALVVRIRRGIARAHPQESPRGAAAYGLMRSMQIRRLRLPPPRVRPGGRRRAKASSARATGVRRGGS